MYTGLVSCHERDYQESTWRVCYVTPVRKVAYAGNAVITPPRSLGRCAPAVRLRRALPSLTEQAQTLSTDSGTTHNRTYAQKKINPEKAAALPFFHRLRLPPTGFTFIEALWSRLRRNPMWLKDAHRFR